MESEIKFPLSYPTDYLACLNNFDVTHVAVKLTSPNTLDHVLLARA